MNTYLSRIVVCLLWLMTAAGAVAQDFDRWFANRTLRVDYSFVGTDKEADLSLIELVSSPGWWGRRHHLDSLALRGNGQITMQDAASGDTIYRMSFSSLFQEWQTTEEATRVRRSFENVYLLPFPKRPADVSVELLDNRGAVKARLRHRVDPSDILIRRTDSLPAATHRYITRGGTPDDCIDVAIVAEGYTEAEMEAFYEDAASATTAIFAHEPFKSLKGYFNVVAVATPSADSGVSQPKQGSWRRTAFGSHFDTFYSDRYLTTLRLRTLHDALAGIPYEHIIILANTDQYGGGGIYNSYVLSSTRHMQFLPVVVHEFGHSFAALADEYAYDDEYSPMYPDGIEPWEQNITTLTDFASKWADLVPAGTPVPTPPVRGTRGRYSKIGLYEGAGYRSRGVYRPCTDCRMRTNTAPEFCPVCRRAIERLIHYYTR